MRKFNKDSRLMITILVLIGILAIGYATLGANLKINGVAEVPASSWSVQFKTGSINVTNGSVPIKENTSQKAATIDSADQVSYQVRLPLPGDFYEFTVVVENTGSIDAMIGSVSSKLGNIEITTGTLPSYLDYSVTYSDGVAIAPHHLLASNTEETYKVRLEFKKDITASDLPAQAETLNLNFQVNYVQKDDTAIDVPHPRNLGDDDWDTIISNAQNEKASLYVVGSTKEVDMGEFGTHTLRVANNSTPAECSTTGFSQTACGFVLEFADVILKYVMNTDYSGSTIGTGNIGGWASSEARTYINSDIYNALPTTLKNAIINTTVVSGHGYNDTENFTTTDKLYLLSTHEVWEDVDGDTSSGIDYNDTAYNNTRQLDYYKNLEVTVGSWNSNTYKYEGNYLGAVKKYNGSNNYWWLRSAYLNTNNFFYSSGTAGNWPDICANNGYGFSPAFRLA